MDSGLSIEGAYIPTRPRTIRERLVRELENERKGRAMFENLKLKPHAPISVTCKSDGYFGMFNGTLSVKSDWPFGFYIALADGTEERISFRTLHSIQVVG